MKKIFALFILLTIAHVQASRHHNRYIESELEENLKYYLNELINSQELSDSFKREKKNKLNNNDDDDENSALASHRKKNGDLNEITEQISNNKQPTCSSQFKFETNYIIDSKKSIQQGAKLLRVEYLTKETAMLGLNGLQESCMKQCCDSQSCDSALVSMRLGPDGYRCYLFACNENCLFIKHNDYIVIKMKTAEQLDNSGLNEANQITTGHKNKKTPCHKTYEFTCLKSKSCIPIYDVCNSFDDCDDKTDEINCTKTKSVTAAATTTTPTIRTKLLTTRTSNMNENNLPNNAELVKEIIEDELSKKIESNDYADYDDANLADRQAEIVDHLNRLISEINYNKNKVIQHSSNNLFDSFMKTKPVNFIKTTTTTKPTTKKFIFHDEYNMDNMLNSFDNDDKIYFVNKDNSVISTSSILMAIFILVAGISLVVAFFAFLILSTKYMSKRVKWIKKFSPMNKSKNVVDVDPSLEADYLINGMYL